MAAAIVLTKGYQYVAASLLSTTFLLVFQLLNVSKHRRLSGTKYPNLYADKAEALVNPAAMKFNCAQRAHANTLEYLPALYVTTLISSIKYPILAASLCGGWAFSRIIYTIGYSTGDPAKRNFLQVAEFGAFALIVQIGLSTWTVVQAIQAGL